MWPWTLRVTLWVIGLECVLTVSPLLYTYLSENTWQELFSRTSAWWVAWAALPSILLLAASLIRRKSAWMQLLVTVAAALFALLIGGTYWYEALHHIRGNRGSFGVTLGYLAFLYGPVGAVPVLLIAAAAAFWDWFRRI